MHLVYPVCPSCPTVPCRTGWNVLWNPMCTTANNLSSSCTCQLIMYKDARKLPRFWVIVYHCKLLWNCTVFVSNLIVYSWQLFVSRTQMAVSSVSWEFSLAVNSSSPSHVSIKTILFWNKVHAAWSVYSNYSDRYTSPCIFTHVTQWNKRCILRIINGDFRACADSGYQALFFPRPPKKRKRACGRGSNVVILFSHTCRWVSTSVTTKEKLYNVVWTHNWKETSLTPIANVSDVYVKGPQFFKVVAEVSCFYLLVYFYLQVYSLCIVLDKYLVWLSIWRVGWHTSRA